MKYKEIGLNADYIASIGLEQWTEKSAQEFGFSKKEAKESHAMALKAVASDASAKTPDKETN